MLAWNAIVKDEARVIERCINSLLPYIDGAIIADTGSKDGTPDIIRRMFESAGKPVEIVHDVPFHDFSSARNAALDAARKSTLGWSELLLCDADMELVVPDRDAFFRSLNGVASYDMQQRAGSVW